MSLSNTSESDALDIFLEGSDPAWRAGATTNNSPFTFALDVGWGG